MSNPLTNLNVKRIHELLELLSPAMAHELVIDDSEGALKPKRLSLTNLAKLLVPYNNAVNDLNLGEHDITALRGLFDAIHLNTDPASIPSDDDIGAMYWDTDALTYSVVLPNGVRGQFGEEMFVLVTRYSTAPNPILNGIPVYTVGEQGQRPTVAVARADDKAKIKVTGIVTHDISNQGRITTFGLVRAIPLARKPAGETWVAGNYLWLAPTGGMTNVEPSRPTPNVRLGLITNVTGSASFDMLVYIRPAMGMYDLYDVNGTAPINGQEITYDSALGYWKATSRLNVLEGDDTTEGSVAKTVKDTAEDATFTDTSGLDSTTLKDAINEIYAEKAVANGLASLDATGKIPVAQLPVSAMEFKGGWDASSGAYPLTPDVGDFWTVSVAGTTEGVEFDAGDAIVYNGATWDKINKVEIAEEVSYDNSSSGLVATNVQDAIDELDERVDDTETALTTLNADADTEGSVAKAVKDGIATVTDQSVKTTSTPSFNGIKFPATQVPSADPNTLDDYEEGTWTPTVEGSTVAGVQTYTVRIGRYTKIGNKVFIQGGFAVTAKDSAIDGGIRITGLPFVSANISGLEGTIVPTRFNGLTFDSGYTQMSLYLLPNASRLGIRQQGSGQTDVDIPATKTSSIFFFVYFGGHYQI